MGGAHPWTYGRDDVKEELIREIRGGAGKNCTYNDGANGTCYLFARKFAPDASSRCSAWLQRLWGLVEMLKIVVLPVLFLLEERYQSVPISVDMRRKKEEIISNTTLLPLYSLEIR
jgi:hypothetical protein